MVNLARARIELQAGRHNPPPHPPAPIIARLKSPDDGWLMQFNPNIYAMLTDDGNVLGLNGRKVKVALVNYGIDPYDAPILSAQVAHDKLVWYAVDRLRKWMLRSNLTQIQAAHMLGVNEKTLQRYIKGDLSNPRMILNAVNGLHGIGFRPNS